VRGGALLWTYGTHDSRGARIAIQPFRTIGSATALRDFAAGVSDSLQTVLTQDQLQILSPAEAQELNGDDVPGEARKLGVGLMFSGTVQPKGSDIDVSMRIDDPVQRATLWAAEMSGPAAKSDQLQARVGALTVAVLNCSQQVLGPRVGLTDTALQAFLHACELSETASHGSAGGSAAYAMLDAMREAARQAPDFAGSHSMLAKHLAYVSPNIPGLRDEAEREAHRALQLDPKDPDALVALGLLRPQLDYAGREFWFRKALASNPAWSHANGFLGNVMSEVGRLQEALELYQRAASVNPLAADWTVVVPLALVQVGQAAAADREIGRIDALWPDNPLLWYWQYDSLVAQKRWGDALKFLDTANKLPSPPSPAWLTARRQLLAALQSGDVAPRMTLRQQLVSANGDDARNTIYELVLLGFVDDAFAVAAHYSPAPTDSPEILFNSELAPLRADPRFMALANRFRLVDYWQHSGHWPDFCSQPGLPYSCAQEAAKLRAAVR
jgi:tetratricopeptide (TPR) repeat protein